MADVLSFTGNIRVLLARLQGEKKAHKDAFFTRATDVIFQDIQVQENIRCGFDVSRFKSASAYEDALSLCYWLATQGLAK